MSDVPRGPWRRTEGDLAPSAELGAAEPRGAKRDAGILRHPPEPAAIGSTKHEPGVTACSPPTPLYFGPSPPSPPASAPASGPGGERPGCCRNGDEGHVSNKTPRTGFCPGLAEAWRWAGARPALPRNKTPSPGQPQTSPRRPGPARRGRRAGTGVQSTLHLHERAGRAAIVLRPSRRFSRKPKHRRWGRKRPHKTPGACKMGHAVPERDEWQQLRSIRGAGGVNV